MADDKPDTLSSWLGQSESARDIVTERLVHSLRAILDSDRHFSKRKGQLPIALHWCLTPTIVQASRLGPDGHPARGEFLPAIDYLPRRMWAGGTLEFLAPLSIGDSIERNSRIADINFKVGHSGALCFVHLDHIITTVSGVAIRERQDIVYRQANNAAPTSVAEDNGALPHAQFNLRLRADPVLLFRYSALTFNGHRVHYDRSYATGEEHYDGLLVHGPLQATFLLEFAAEISGKAPHHFMFRAVRPLYDGVDFFLKAQDTERGLALWVENERGETTMRANAW